MKATGSDEGNGFLGIQWGVDYQTHERLAETGRWSGGPVSGGDLGFVLPRAHQADDHTLRWFQQCHTVFSAIWSEGALRPAAGRHLGGVQ